MRLNFGTRLYEALAEMPEPHRKFFLARQDREYDRTLPRCTGRSSDAMVFFALGMQQEPGKHEYPLDRGDLRACEEAYDMAPADLQDRMLPVLTRYRLASAEWPAPFTGPGYDAHPGRDHEDCCK